MSSGDSWIDAIHLLHSWWMAVVVVISCRCDLVVVLMHFDMLKSKWDLLKINSHFRFNLTPFCWYFTFVKKRDFKRRKQPLGSDDWDSLALLRVVVVSCSHFQEATSCTITWEWALFGLILASGCGLVVEKVITPLEVGGSFPKPCHPPLCKTLNPGLPTCVMPLVCE